MHAQHLKVWIDDDDGASRGVFHRVNEQLVYAVPRYALRRNNQYHIVLLTHVFP